MCSLNLVCSLCFKKKKDFGASLVVEQLRLHAPNTGGLYSIPGWGTRSHRPQLTSSTAKKKKFLYISKIKKKFYTYIYMYTFG